MVLGAALRFGPTALLHWLAGRGPAARTPRRHLWALHPRLTSRELGSTGEEIAARSLLAAGLSIRARNVRGAGSRGHGAMGFGAREFGARAHGGFGPELDIVAQDGNEIVVVEVKTGWWPESAPQGWKRPRDHVHPEHARKRLRAARILARGFGPSRFEIVEVLCGRGPTGVEVQRTRGGHNR